jgi:general secretion pathway protein G
VTPRYRSTRSDSSPRAYRGARVAFTLVELLAVVTIIGILIAIAFPKMQELVDRAKVVKAISDLKRIAVDLNGRAVLPASLAQTEYAGLEDPWGRPYVYFPFPPPKGKGKGGPPQGARKDKFLVPINSRFDLYSLGRDGGSMPPLTAKPSRDDVVVANDGGFIGLARNY